MKKTVAILALIGSCLAIAFAQAVPPELFARRFPILTGATTTTACDSTKAVRSTSLPKTYQAVASVVAGTGTAIVSVLGSMDANSWTTINTITVPMTSATAAVSAGFDSVDRYVFVCGNVTVLGGSTPTLSLSAGY